MPIDSVLKRPCLFNCCFFVKRSLIWLLFEISCKAEPFFRSFQVSYYQQHLTTVFDAHRFCPQKILFFFFCFLTVPDLTTVWDFLHIGTSFQVFSSVSLLAASSDGFGLSSIDLVCLIADCLENGPWFDSCLRFPAHGHKVTSFQVLASVLLLAASSKWFRCP